MKLSDNVIIPDDKIRKYLLVYRDEDDKSKYLAKGGFTKFNPEQLKNAIISMVSEYDAIEDKSNQYGTFYKVNGDLEGVNNCTLRVTTIWLKRKIDNKIQFITLKPNKEKNPHHESIPKSFSK